MPVTIRSESGRSPKVTLSVARLAMPETSRRAVDAAGRAMQKAVTTSLRTVAPSGRLRGVGKSGAALSVSRRFVASGAEPRMLVKAVGPWQFIEGDTKPHVILPKSFGSRRVRRDIGAGLFVRAAGRRLSRGRRAGTDAFIGAQHAGAIRTPSGLRVYARHPGTRGQHPWRRGVERGTPAATLAFVETVRRDLRRQFG